MEAEVEMEVEVGVELVLTEPGQEGREGLDHSEGHLSLLLLHHHHLLLLLLHLLLCYQWEEDRAEVYRGGVVTTSQTCPQKRLRRLCEFIS